MCLIVESIGCVLIFRLGLLSDSDCGRLIQIIFGQCLFRVLSQFIHIEIAHIFCAFDRACILHSFVLHIVVKLAFSTPLNGWLLLLLFCRLFSDSCISIPSFTLVVFFIVALTYDTDKLNKNLASILAILNWSSSPRLSQILTFFLSITLLIDYLQLLGLNLTCLGNTLSWYVSARNHSQLRSILLILRQTLLQIRIHHQCCLLHLSVLQCNMLCLGHQRQLCCFILCIDKFLPLWTLLQHHQ